ncbi:hypothetical protein MHM83_01035 [Tenacibaculum sp. Mcav3-52]|nr:hypothetical protein [Tenacibaculum sp. Mcav3-52]MCG7500445.1 hypothetical protein [Tenacibaculum sp. Mcav3-52]
MSRINLVMSLSNFYSFILEVIEKEDCVFYLEKRVDDNSIVKVEIGSNNLSTVIANKRGRNLNFYLSTKKIDNENGSLYDETICNYVIEGTGGRETEEIIERISLRVISKTPDKSIKRVFNKIKSKLKSDESVGVGVKGSSSLHKNFFYQKDLVGSKMFKVDLYKDKSPIIKVV